MTPHLPLHIPVWDAYCHILLWPKDPRALLKRLKVPADEITEVMEDEFRAITLTLPSGNSIIWIRKPMRRAELIGTIAHEAHHAAQDMLEERGVFVRRGDANEAQAYMVGYIVEQAVKRLL